MTAAEAEGARLATAGPDGRVSAAAGWYGLGVLIATSAFALVVRSVFSLEVDPIKLSLSLSDTDIGLLDGLALSLATSLAAFPVSWLADRSDRRRLVALCVLAWSAATAACGLSRSFGDLLVCTAGVGVAEAVLGPIGYSMVADLFPRRLWIVANYINTAASLVGAGAVMALSGAMIGAIDAAQGTLPAALAGQETWRLAMFAAAVPGPLIAAALLLIRRTAPPAPGGDAGERGVLAYFARNRRTALGLFGGFGLAVAGQAAAGNWVAVVAIRVFGEAPAEAGVRLGLVAVLASLAGVAASAVAVRLLQPRLGPRAPLAVSRMGVALAFAATPLYLLAGAAWQIYLIAGVQTAAILVGLSVSPTILQFMAPRAIRARVITIGGMASLLLRSLSPIGVGRVSDALPPGDSALLEAMVLVSLPCFLGASLLLRLAEPSLLATFADAEQADAERPA